jgi:DNA-binding response OmpR family regulator
MAKTILVVDDEKRLRDLVQAYLSQEGFRVVTAADGQEALFVARHEKPDLILLDLMMPEMGGYEFLRAHSKERDTPVIVLTAKLEENDKVLGLELGADDYVTKPFSMRELTARVRAVLRRVGDKASETEVLRGADITLDLSSRLATVGEARVDLTPSEFDLLAVLMSAPGRAFPRYAPLTFTSAICGPRSSPTRATRATWRRFTASAIGLRSMTEKLPHKPGFFPKTWFVNLLRILCDAHSLVSL